MPIAAPQSGFVSLPVALAADQMNAEALAADGGADAAREALTVARDRLLERAARIEDPSWRERFLTSVEENATEPPNPWHLTWLEGGGEGLLFKVWAYCPEREVGVNGAQM